ncbi:MAG: ThiF family adenylyltransferase [Phycisphaerales bacterium]|nr:ThiF family adenylyltransferase [Phycisphaerales bacterium]
MPVRSDFYGQRDRRSLQFGLNEDFFERPVHISIGPQCAASRAGQSAALALLNMAARLHRSIVVESPGTPLQSPALNGGSRFDDAAHNLLRAVDPFLGSGSPRARVGASVGLGEDARRGLDWYVGAVGGVAFLAREPVPFEPLPSPSLAGSFAACLGAMALCRRLLEDQLMRPDQIDVWRWGRADVSSAGSPRARLDVGDVLVVGAGGVGSCFAYWASEFGHQGRWAVADGDNAELHNTNRCMGIFPADAGWPDPPGVNKAVLAARLLDATPIPKFYHDLSEAEARADLVLPLANEHEVRRLIGQRGDPILLHATTSPSWEAQLHRHIPDSDGCIVCRMPPSGPRPTFRCSEVPVSAESSAAGASTDAALPFLSGAAGLMLVRGLLLLQHGELSDTPSNMHSLRMKDARGLTGRSRFPCDASCDRTLLPAVRALVQRGRRWAEVDVKASRSAARV